MSSSQEIDQLFVEYGILDDDGFLVGTSHPNIMKVYGRIEALSVKTCLTSEETDEAVKLTMINREYLKELNKYVRHEVMKIVESVDSEEDDDSFVESEESEESEESVDDDEYYSEGVSEEK